MEIIKKTIKQLLTTGTTTGCTGTCRVIIPVSDSGVTFNYKLLLTQVTDDIGFFDAYEVVDMTGTTINYIPHTVTGESTSRLSELRKYSVSPIFANQYVSGGSLTVDGVDYPNSISGVSVTYYLGGIKYIDKTTSTGITTTFTFVTLGLTNPNFINKPIYKNPQKENIISNPKIDNDVFIIRQELSAFENNYRLEHVKSLVDLDSYAGGKYFNVVKNG